MKKLDFDEIIVKVSELCPEITHNIHRDQLTITVPQDKLKDVALKLRDDPETLFDMLVDISAIDWYDKKKPRFELVYFLYSNEYKFRVRLKTPVEDNNLECPSVVDIWESANWYERETYDMYGVIFKGHPGLRRFYMPEDFVDPASGDKLHPLRKDFPLMGIPDSLPLPPFPERDGYN